MEKIAVVVVDDHPLFRQGVVDTMSLEEDILVVGEAENGDDAIALIKEKEPQIAILDINLPGMNGLQITKKVKHEEKLPTNVILLTAYDDMEQAVHSMRSGATAYRPKCVKPEELIQTVRDVASGSLDVEKNRVHRSSSDRWFRDCRETLKASHDSPDEPVKPMSNREMEILSLIIQGLSNQEIAISLGIGHQTVKNHISSILRKMGVVDRTQAAVFALHLGWFR